MKRKVLCILLYLLYLIGLLTSFLLFVYVISAMLFVFSNAGDPGLIAWVPKWIFLFCPLVLLGKTRAVREVDFPLL